MNVQPVKPDESHSVKLICSRCCAVRPDAEMYAVLDEKPFTYICQVCLPKEK